MRNVVAALLWAGSMLALPAAQAGPYMDAVRVQQTCQSIGEVGASAFQARPSTAGIMDSFDLESAARVWLQRMDALQPIPAGREGDIIRDTAMYAFTRAASARDAYEYGWARCMDVYGPPPLGSVVPARPPRRPPGSMPTAP